MASCDFARQRLLATYTATPDPALTSGQQMLASARGRLLGVRSIVCPHAIAMPPKLASRCEPMAPRSRIAAMQDRVPVPSCLESFPAGGLAVVIGVTGGIGGAFFDLLGKSERFAAIVGLSRQGDPAIEITSEASVAEAARAMAARHLPIQLVIVAIGVLHDGALTPEKSWRQLDPAHMARAFAINAIGPALLMKHFLPLLPREGKSVFAALSARVGSVGDNRLGGWYSYRASKAALNQFVRTASIELSRSRPDAICVALHPGTVATRLSSPFAKSSIGVQSPDAAAGRLLAVIDRLTTAHSGGFFDHRGEPVPW